MKIKPKLPALQLNRRNISIVKYLGVIFDRKMAWRLHIKRTAAKALTTYAIEIEKRAFGHQYCDLMAKGRISGARRDGRC